VTNQDDDDINTFSRIVCRGDCRHDHFRFGGTLGLTVRLGGFVCSVRFLLLDDRGDGPWDGIGTAFTWTWESRPAYAAAWSNTTARTLDLGRIGCRAIPLESCTMGRPARGRLRLRGCIGRQPVGLTRESVLIFGGPRPE